MKKQSPLDRSLYNNLYDFDAPVSDAHWDKLEAVLDKKNNKKPVPFFWILGSVAFLVVGTAIGTTFFKETPIQKNNVATSKIALPNHLENETNNKINTSAENEIPKIQTPIKPQAAPSYLDDLSVKNTISPIKQITNNQIENNLIVNAAVEEKEATLSFENLKENANLPGYAFDPMYLENYAADAVNIKAKISKKKIVHKPKREIGINAVVGFYAVNKITMNLPDGYRHNPIFSDGRVDAVSNIDIQGPNLGLSLNFRQYLNPNTFISSGLDMSFGRYTIHYLISDNSGNKFQIKDGHLNYARLGLPITIGQRIFNKKSEVFIEGGASINANLQSNSQLFNIESMVLEKVKMKSNIIAPKLGLLFKIPFNNQLNINASYQVQYNRFKTSSSYNYQMSGLQHQLGAGLTVGF